MNSARLSSECAKCSAKKKVRQNEIEQKLLQQPCITDSSSTSFTEKKQKESAKQAEEAAQVVESVPEGQAEINNPRKRSY